MPCSKRRAMLAGFVLGCCTCLLLLTAAGAAAWQYRLLLASRLARPYAAQLAGQLFHALPDGYVTKNRERVICALDEFTNAVSRGEAGGREIERVSKVLLDGLADGRLSYAELDALLATMKIFASGHSSGSETVEKR